MSREPRPSTPVRDAVLEVERFAAESGWDRPPSLFALVSTSELLAQRPELAESLGEAVWTPVQQDGVPAEDRLERFLAELSWPATVGGCALVLERLMLPAHVESELADDVGARQVAEHPERIEMRLAAGALRDGSAHCLARLRGSGEVYEGPSLVPGLTALLAATLED